MLNKFVLIRKHDHHASHVQLILKDFLYQRRGAGRLDVPNLAALLKAPAPPAPFAVYQRHDCDGYSELDVSELRTAEVLFPRTLSVQCFRLSHHLSAAPWQTDPVAAGFCMVESNVDIMVQDLMWHDLPPPKHASYSLRQPIWFHMDAMLHYEQTPRTTTRTAHRRYSSMVVKPQRSFQLHVSRVFGVRSLADFIRHGGIWPSQQDFVQRHIGFTLGSVLPGRQAQWLRVLYKKATQVVERLGAALLVLPLTSSRRHSLPYLGCSSGDKVCLIPLILRSVTSSSVDATHAGQTTSDDYPLLAGWCGPDTILRAIPQASAGDLPPVFADLQFRLAFRLLPVRSRFWFLEASNPSMRSYRVWRNRDREASVL